jgi:hypothetical protein
MTLYSADALETFAGKLYPLVHPYTSWQTYSSREPQRVVDLIVGCLSRKAVSGFDKRLKQAQTDHSISSFYGFLSELKVASLLAEKDITFSFLLTSNNPSPDFRAEIDSKKIYVEVTTPRKHYPALQACEEGLQKIDHRFKFGRKYALMPTYEGHQPGKPFAEIEIYKLIEKRLADYSDEPLKANPIPVWGNSDEHTLFGLLVDDQIERVPDPNNAHGDHHDSTAKFIQEILDAKKNKNNLKNLRPNILWVEGLWIAEWQTAEMDKVPWNDLNWPDEIDALVLTVCGIDSTYSSESVKFVSLRSDLDAVNKACILSLLSKLFPNWLSEAEVVS